MSCLVSRLIAAATTAAGDIAVAQIAQISLLPPYCQGTPAAVNPAAPQHGVGCGNLSGR
jgi:hypothetical protein